ncbi:hypothetical protein NC653_001783 [Populus alba x Populus x berolinensis]|uniref:Uncharacterized protein n=1 Tax=Populus alba x Populus x berolinensis TaxID=444605 RepID=A0AAD6WFY0_9ROSI|nr:hypothetical protein NC653_001783 [Populus alba x Populus x berolinensis]
MASPTSVRPWLRSNVLVSTSCVVAPPCFFAGIFRVMISHLAIAYTTTTLAIAVTYIS